MRAIPMAIACALVVISLIPVVSNSDTSVEPAAGMSFILHGKLSGWGFTRDTITSPGPTLTVNLGDTVSMTLFAADNIAHTWFVDYNGNRASDTGEPDSGVFSSSTTPKIMDPFPADRAGTFQYWCEIHLGHMVGTFVVRSPNTAPTLSPLVAMPAVATPGQVVTFESTAADADGDPLSFTFTFGDGANAMGTTPAGGGKITGTHAYAAEGAYTATLTVLDGKGGTASASTQVTVTVRIEVTATAPWAQLYPGQTMDLMVLAAVRGSPLAGASAVGTVSPGATLNPSAGTTDAAGTWKTTVQTNPDAAGTITVSVTVEKAPFLPGSAILAITIVSQRDLVMGVTSNRREMMSFETATIRVRLESGAVGVDAGLITPSTRFGGTFGAVTELGGGSYAFGWNAPARTTQGFARIDVRAKVGGYTDAAGFVTILVDPNKTNEFDPTQLFLLTSSPASVTAGGSGKVTVFAFTIEGFVVSGGTVTASLRGVGTLTVVVDELNGVYTFTYVAPASVASPTNVLITISAIKFGYAIATTRIGITVLPAPNVAPVPDFTATRTLMAVAVDASSSSDADGTIVEYRWDWGDGFSESSGISPTASHTYTTPGKYTIALFVTDDRGAASTAARIATVNTSTIDYEFYDFFNVPFGEWWDYRARAYGENPIGAECWNATAITNGVCTPTLPDVPDVASYPYAIWTYTELHRVIYAPYRMRATAVNAPGYNLSEPVFLPVMNYSQPAGDFLAFRWYAQFLDSQARQMLRARGCPIDAWGDDGYIIRSQVSLTMDLQQSRRIFNVDATNPSGARHWWESNTDPSCAGKGPIEQKLLDWLYWIDSTKYDIWNTYYFWSLGQLYLDMRAVVDTDGTTHVTIDQVAWGMANLLGRMFYWGNASYIDHYLDSTKARGWYGMEPWAWFEDFDFTGSLTPTGIDFRLTTVLVFHLSHIALPGPDGLLNQVGDIPVWAWRPHLADWVIPRSPNHPYSEVLRYPGVSDVGSTPGDAMYGKSHPRDFVPTRWDLRAGETWHFQFPTGNAVFYDPNLTPIPANPRSNDFVKIVAPLRLLGTTPQNYGAWDPQTFTWDVVGPSTTGGPDGTPGPDGMPGTADDEYAQESWGAIYFVPDRPSGPIPPAAVTDLAVDPTMTTQTSLTPTWTATGDDGTVGTGYLYDLRCAKEPIAGAPLLIPCLSTRYRYAVVPFDQNRGFEQPGFDDSRWSLGDEGFGTPSGSYPLNNPTYVRRTGR